MNKSEILQEAFCIYNQVEEIKNHLIINTILKLCLHLRQPYHISKIWSDIEQCKQLLYNPNDHISFELLMICCIKSNDINIYKCVQILNWMKHCNLTLKLNNPTTISMLISKCNSKHHLKELMFIDTLIQDNSIVNDGNVFIKSALIGAYGRCCDLNSALYIFNSLKHTDTNIVCVNAIMKALINNNYEQDAMKIYNKFMGYDLYDNITHFLAIKACKNLRYFEKGKQIISNINIKKTNVLFKTGLIDFYGANSEINKAFDIFQSINDKEKDSYCVGSMIKQFVANNYNIEALKLYDIYSSLQNNVCHLFAIKACTKIGDIYKGKDIHNKVKENEYSYDLKLKNTLIYFYGQSKNITDALDVFDSIDHNKKDNITYNSMMQAYIRCNLFQQALDMYDNLLKKDAISHSLALRACIHTKDTEKGKFIHHNLEQKLNEYNQQCIELKSSLIDFYGSFDIVTAWNIFDSVMDEHKTGRFIGAMMKACINNGDNKNALHLYDTFETLKNETIQMLGIKACTNICDFDKGKQIHYGIDFESSASCLDLKNTLIHFYGNAMDIHTAFDIFNSINNHQKDIITINAMMDAYCISNMNNECIDLFNDISNINKLIIADIVTYKIVVTAITFVTSMDIAIDIYNELKTNHFEMLNDSELQIKLINMNSKYGMIENCNEIFEVINKENQCDNIDVWNAMIRCYCSNDDFNSGYKIYKTVKDSMNIKLNENTYIILLNACSHCGELENAYNIWQNEIDEKQYKFNVSVINAMVDCFGRRGYLNNAHDFIIKFERNTKQKSDVIWNTLMSGCCKYNDKLMGQYVYNQMRKRFKIQSNSMTGAKLSLSNIYTSNAHL